MTNENQVIEDDEIKNEDKLKEDEDKKNDEVVDDSVEESSDNLLGELFLNQAPSEEEKTLADFLFAEPNNESIREKYNELVSSLDSALDLSLIPSKINGGRLHILLRANSNKAGLLE